MVLDEVVIVARGMYLPDIPPSPIPSGKYFIAILHATGATVYTHSETWRTTFANIDEAIATGFAYFASDPRQLIFANSFLNRILSDNAYSMLNCDIANRIQYRQRVFTQELVNFYVVSVKQEYFNPIELDFVNMLYIVDRSERYINFINKTVGQIRGMVEEFLENVLLLLEINEGVLKRDLIIAYNKALYYTVYSRREINSINNAVCKKVLQIWDITEVNDITKRFDNALEGTIVFNNIDNELVDREAKI